MRALLLFLSRHERLKDFLLRFRFFRKTATRFVAGDTLSDAIRAAAAANQRGIRGTLDLLGENVDSLETALSAKREICEALDDLDHESLDCSVSVKLTQLGLDFDPEFCFQNLCAILERAERFHNFVRVDMENSEYTDRTLAMVTRAHETFANVGAVIQAYLHRSEADIRELLEHKVQIRLCKGAYSEPDTIAFRKMSDTRANFLQLMKILLGSKIHHGIATHDEALIDASCRYVREKGISTDQFEFQMLYGIRRDIQKRLVQEGFRLRIYIPYGRAWYPYFMRRLGERPANAFFLVKNLFRQ